MSACVHICHYDLFCVLLQLDHRRFEITLIVFVFYGASFVSKKLKTKNADVLFKCTSSIRSDSVA